MIFRAEEYFRAATERMRQARAIHGVERSYALAMYCGGLAVECLLRAFRWKEDTSFEGRHDLDDLLKASNLLGINEKQMRRHGISEDEIIGHSVGMRAALNEIVALWHNNLRFASENRLRAFLHQKRRLQGVKGNALKKSSLDLLNAAQNIIDRGVSLWTSKRR
jgi:hypothetical protein